MSGNEAGKRCHGTEQMLDSQEQFLQFLLRCRGMNFQKDFSLGEGSELLFPEFILAAGMFWRELGLDFQQWWHGGYLWGAAAPPSHRTFATLPPSDFLPVFQGQLGIQRQGRVFESDLGFFFFFFGENFKF